MKRQRASSSTLFLMELIVAVLYFVLAATVCISIFVKAHLMSVDAKEKNAGINFASDTAEIVRTSGGRLATEKILSKLYPEMMLKDTGDGSVIQIYFDEDRNACVSDDAYYYEDITLKEEEGQLFAKIRILNEKEKSVYKLNINHVIPGGQ